MTDRISDIRKIMDMLEGESTGAHDAPQMLNEGPIGAVKSMLHKREGSKQRAQVAAQLMKQYHVWLGKMDRQGTMSDIEDFLRQENFSDSELDTILGPAQPAQDKAENSPNAETPAQEEPEAEEPEAEEPEQGEEDNTYDPEEGKPLPGGDEKLSNYADLKPGETGASEEEPEAEQPEDEHTYHGAEKNFKDKKGNWDHDKIQAQLEKLGPGAKLVLGNHRFSLQDKAGNDDVVDEPVAAESVVESVLLEYGPKVGSGQLKDIFNKAAVAFIAKNGGRQASNQRSGSVQSNPQRDASAGGSKGGKGGDPYDLDAMWSILQKNGMSKAQVTKLMNKVRSSNSMSTLSDNELQDLSLLGFAFIKSSN